MFDKKLYLAKLFNEDKRKFVEELINFYYTIYPNWCCIEYNAKLFDNIDIYDFVTPIKRLKEYYKPSQSNYYEILYDNIKKYTNIITSHNIITENNKYIDQMMIEFCKCRENISIITLWPKAILTKNKLNELLSLLNNNGNVYYLKTINLSYDGAQSLLYQLYADSGRMKDISSINYKLNRIGWIPNKKSQFTVIVYEYTGKNNIRGSSVTFKKIIRNIWLKDTKINNSLKENNKPRQYDYVHINDYYYQTVEYSQIFFNQNSLHFLEIQLLPRYLNIQNKNRSSYVQLNTYKKIILFNFDPIDQIRSIIYSSSVLYTYGLRISNDVDGMFLSLPKSQTKNFDKKIGLFFKNKGTKIPFTDIALKDTEGWEDYWEKYLIKIAKLSGVKNFDEIILNPDNHYYFNGLKFVTLRIDIIKRLIRLRPNAYVDIIGINKLLGYNIYLPAILKTIPYYKNNIDKNIFLNGIQKGLKYRYQINISIDDIKKYISNKKVSIGIEYCKSNQNCVNEFISDFDDYFTKNV